jgi:hypothetical protein
MSSTGRASERIALDGYPTPRWCVHRLLEAYELPCGPWLEPCAGAGSIIQAVNEVREDVGWFANEIDPQYEGALRGLHVDVTIGDAQTLVAPGAARVTITNPPFGPSLDILRNLLQYDALVIFLQRLNWSCGPRRELFRAEKPSVFPLPDRPSFMDFYEEETPEKLEAQTDSIEYAWFVFDGRAQFRVLGDTHEDVRRAEILEGRASGIRPKKLKPKKKKKEAA